MKRKEKTWAQGFADRADALYKVPEGSSARAHLEVAIRAGLGLQLTAEGRYEPRSKDGHDTPMLQAIHLMRLALINIDDNNGFWPEEEIHNLCILADLAVSLEKALQATDAEISSIQSRRAA